MMCIMIESYIMSIFGCFHEALSKGFRNGENFFDATIKWLQQGKNFCSIIVVYFTLHDMSFNL